MIIKLLMLFGALLVGSSIVSVFIRPDVFPPLFLIGIGFFLLGAFAWSRYHEGPYDQEVDHSKFEYEE